ncbi:hypothetical protein [Xanthobacter agilis]|jgi:hypothetical protein|uniref:Uncharacterized protein n=1 Tax=Xanthobacter agilis TaxID=47492 RepID=A0ABU0LED4_XANAG|nr:hypothetical protein [Xanthobacter agilis]MDQ0505511.1 hypothetical protein [Xanthobacter agilis]
MLKTLLMAGGLAMLASAASAQGMVRSTDLSCAQAARLIAEKGAVVMATSPTLYDRYVRDLSFCDYDMQLKPEWVPTRDNPQCFIGYICYEPSRGGGRSGG